MSPAKAKAKAKTRQSKSMAEEIDCEQAKSARKKRAAGEKPTRDELAALRREEARVDRESLERHIEQIPKSLVLDAMALSAVQVHRLADRWGVPLRGRTVSVLELLTWVRDFLEENRERLSVDLAGGPATVSLDRLRSAQAAKVERQNKVASGDLVPRDALRRVLDYVARVFRDAHGEIIRRHGSEVQAILEEARGRALERLARFEAEQDSRRLQVEEELSNEDVR